MTLLYDAWYSFVLLRPIHEVKRLTQSADKQICIGKWPVPCGAILFLRLQKCTRRSDFSGGPFSTNAIPEKNSTNGRGGGDKKEKTRIKRSIFCQFLVDFWPIFLFWALLLKIQSAITPSLHGFWSIAGAVFAKGVVTRVAPEMKYQDTHEQHFPNKIREIARGWKLRLA